MSVAAVLDVVTQVCLKLEDDALDQRGSSPRLNVLPVGFEDDLRIDCDYPRIAMIIRRGSALSRAQPAMPSRGQPLQQDCFKNSLHSTNFPGHGTAEPSTSAAPRRAGRRAARARVPRTADTLGRCELDELDPLARVRMDLDDDTDTGLVVLVLEHARLDRREVGRDQTSPVARGGGGGLVAIER